MGPRPVEMILVVVLVVLGISPERTTRITFIGVSTTGLSLRHTNRSQSDGLLANGPQIQFSRCPAPGSSLP